MANNNFQYPARKYGVAPLVVGTRCENGHDWQLWVAATKEPAGIWRGEKVVGDRRTWTSYRQIDAPAGDEVVVKRGGIQGVARRICDDRGIDRSWVTAMVNEWRVREGLEPFPVRARKAVTSPLASTPNTAPAPEPTGDAPTNLAALAADVHRTLEDVRDALRTAGWAGTGRISQSAANAARAALTAPAAPAPAAPAAPAPAAPAAPAPAPAAPAPAPAAPSAAGSARDMLAQSLSQAAAAGQWDIVRTLAAQLDSM